MKRVRKLTESSQGEILFLGQTGPFGWTQHGTVHFSKVKRPVQTPRIAVLKAGF